MLTTCTFRWNIFRERVETAAPAAQDLLRPIPYTHAAAARPPGPADPTANYLQPMETLSLRAASAMHLCPGLLTPCAHHFATDAAHAPLTCQSRCRGFRLRPRTPKPPRACAAGACLQPPQNCWLVCEYLPGGTLSQWLYGTRGDPR